MFDEGGPAFARPGSIMEGDWYYPQDGMSLRDYFAAKALAGVVAGTATEKMKPASPAEAAHWAYQIADAMLVARLKTPAPEAADGSTRK